jgi:hypothetical protein
MNTSVDRLAHLDCPERRRELNSMSPDYIQDSSEP